MDNDDLPVLAAVLCRPAKLTKRGLEIIQKAALRRVSPFIQELRRKMATPSRFLTLTSHPDVPKDQHVWVNGVMVCHPDDLERLTTTLTESGLQIEAPSRQVRREVKRRLDP